MIDPIFLQFLLQEKQIWTLEHYEKYLSEFEQWFQQQNSRSEGELEPKTAFNTRINPCQEEDSQIQERSLEEAKTQPFTSWKSTFLPPLSGSPSKKNGSFLDRYQILSTLGEGGMGIVQNVQDCVLGREVALKTIRSNLWELSRFSSKNQNHLLWRFTQEASIMAQLEHPNIVPLYDLQKNERGDFYFTMRKIEGKTLETLLKEMTHPLSSQDEDLLLTIFFKVCDAVAYAHSRQIIHRDLKPENIMLGLYGEVYVMDWGISKHLQEKESQENVLKSDSAPENDNDSDMHTVGGIGTPGYMSPEQTKNAYDVGITTDIYALGKILRQCYTGVSPFEEMRLHLKDKVESSSNAKTFFSVPKDIVAISQKAVEYEAKNRYLSVSAFIDDLKRYRQNQIISARRYNFFELLLKWCQRNKKQLLSITLISLLCLTSGWILWQFHQQQKRIEHQQQRLNYWLTRLQSERVEEGEPEDAIFELVRLTEPVIFEQLLKILSEGTRYYLEESLQTSQKNQFYETIVVALGRQENPKAAPHFLKALQDLMQQIAHKKTLTQVHYFSLLAQALAHSAEEASYAEKLQEIRHKMGQNELFWSKTQRAYILLLNKSNRKEHKTMLAAEDYARKAELFFGQNKLPETISHYTKAIELNPKIPWFYTSRGVAKANSGDLDGAISDHSEAIRQWPNYRIAYENRAVAYLRQNQTDKAIEDYNQSIQLEPLLPWGYAGRGNAYAFKQEFKKAMNDFNQAITISRDVAEFYINRGLLYTQIRNYSKALEDFNQALQINPQLIEAYFKRGWVREVLGDFQNALQDYNEVLQKNPNHSDAYRLRGRLKHRFGDLSGAIADLTTAVQKEPENWENYYYRAQVQMQQEHYLEAIEDCTKTLQLNPKMDICYYYRGRAFWELKKVQQSEQDFHEFLLKTEGTDIPFFVDKRNKIFEWCPQFKKK